VKTGGISDSSLSDEMKIQISEKSFLSLTDSRIGITVGYLIVKIALYRININVEQINSIKDLLLNANLAKDYYMIKV